MKNKNKEFVEALLSILPEDIKTELMAHLVPSKEKQFLEFTDIKTFDDACQACGTSEDEFYLKWSDLLLPSDTFAYEQIKLIVKAINQGWTPDWNDTSQRKWWPYFKLSSGFGFSSSSCNCGYADTAAGSRLCFETQEKSDYAGAQFTELYKEFITITK